MYRGQANLSDNEAGVKVSNPSVEDDMCRLMPKVITDFVKQRMPFPMHIPQIYQVWRSMKYTDLEIIAWLISSMEAETLETYGQDHPNCRLDRFRYAQNWIDLHKQRKGLQGVRRSVFDRRPESSSETDRNYLLY